MPCSEPRPRRDTYPTCPCTSTSSPRVQTVCVTYGTLRIQFSAIIPEHHATSSSECYCPLTAAPGYTVWDIGKFRRAFVRARMWSRGPLHCSLMTLACQKKIRFGSCLAASWGFHYERMTVVLRELVMWGVLTPSLNRCSGAWAQHKCTSGAREETIDSIVEVYFRTHISAATQSGNDNAQWLFYYLPLSIMYKGCRPSQR
jgi:hypothetical protein